MMQEGNKAVLIQAEDKHDNCQEYDKVANQEQLTDIQVKQSIQLLKSNGEIIGDKVTEMDRTVLELHYIDVRNTKPIHQRPYREIYFRKLNANTKKENLFPSPIIDEALGSLYWVK